MEAFMDSDDLAKALGVSRGTIQNWAEAKKIGYYKIGGELKFTKKDLDTYLEAHRIEARPTFRRG